MNRGDVLLARFPHPLSERGKKRPVVAVQADAYNQALRTLVVAEVTKNLRCAHFRKSKEFLRHEYHG